LNGFGLKLKYGSPPFSLGLASRVFRHCFLEKFISQPGQILFMVAEGEIAPFFSEKSVGDGADEFLLERKLDYGPVVLAFFPAAFSSPCEDEMEKLGNLQKRLERRSGNVVGISTDSPFPLEAFREQREIDFELVSDMSQRVSQSYEVNVDIPELGLYGVANRAVFVLDTEGKIVYKWVAEDPANQPDIDEIKGEVHSLKRH
jgi:peroxiredoxin